MTTKNGFQVYALVLLFLLGACSENKAQLENIQKAVDSMEAIAPTKAEQECLDRMAAQPIKPMANSIEELSERSAPISKQISSFTKLKLQINLIHDHVLVDNLVSNKTTRGVVIKQIANTAQAGNQEAADRMLRSLLHSELEPELREQADLAVKQFSQELAAEIEKLTEELDTLSTQIEKQFTEPSMPMIPDCLQSYYQRIESVSAQ